MILRDELLEIGIFNKPHGINGEISISFKFDDDEFENLEKIIVDIDGIFVPFFIEDIRFKNNITALVSLDGIESEDDAKMFINKKIYCLKTDFLESDEMLFDSESLIGFTIKEPNGEIIGIVDDIDDSTENYLFIVNHNDKEVYIPIVDDFIIDVDSDNRIIVMDLPSGIVNL